MKPSLFFVLSFFSCFFVGIVFAQPVDYPAGVATTGDVAIAEKYRVWAQKTIDEGRWGEALLGLEKAADFADVSSDISYLLAIARLHERRPVRSALEAVRLALVTGRFRYYSPEQCRLLEAEILLRLRAFSTAVEVLSAVPSSADAAYRYLLALKGLDKREAFDKAAYRFLETYPRDPRFTRVVFDYFTGKVPLQDGNEQEIITLLLKRLPLLLDSDPTLAYRAVPFIFDIEEARYLVATYRAINEPVPASIPVALNLGIIDENKAIEEVFQHEIDKAVLFSIWKLLRTDSSRDIFRRNLLSYTGVLTEDTDNDGFIEVQIRYEAGRIAAYSGDVDQDGVFETHITFENGVAVGAVLNGTLNVRWERYPAVQSADYNGTRYIPKPSDLFFAPLRMEEFAGVLYPARNPLATVLTERTLLATAVLVERESQEFSGAIEQIEIERGVPTRAREFLDGVLVSETSFRLGIPVSQRVDLDLDGYLETNRIFNE
jgi:hypothetical protein